MASLERDPQSGRYRIRFRYDGQAFKRSDSKWQALASLGQVVDVLRMLELGMTELPPDVDEGTFIVSGARLPGYKNEASTLAVKSILRYRSAVSKAWPMCWMCSHVRRLHKAQAELSPQLSTMHLQKPLT